MDSIDHLSSKVSSHLSSIFLISLLFETAVSLTFCSCMLFVLSSHLHCKVSTTISFLFVLCCCNKIGCFFFLFPAFTANLAHCVSISQSCRGTLCLRYTTACSFKVMMMRLQALFIQMTVCQYCSCMRPPLSSSLHPSRFVLFTRSFVCFPFCLCHRF